MASHDNIESSDEFYDEGSGEEEETEESDDEDEDDDEGESFAEDGHGASDLEGGRPTDDDEDESEDGDDITDSSEEKADKEYADEPRNKENKEERRRRLGLVICCCFLVILLAVILGVTLGGKEDVNPSTPTNSKSIPPSPAPTQSLVPTSLPSLDEGAVDFNATMDPTDDFNATVSPSDSPALDDNITDSTASPSSAVAPSDPPGGGNATTLPTSPATQTPTSSKSPSQAPTLDPAKIYFPVVADTFITKATARRRAQSGNSLGTSGVLQVASTNETVASVTLLQFALTELPPPENELLQSSFHLHLVTIPSTASAPISIYRYISQVALDIESMVWDDSLSFLSAGRVQAGSFPEGQIVEGTTFSVASNDIVKVPITDLLSTDDIVVRRRNLQDAATTTILLLLQIDPANGPGEQSFKSREAGAIVAPVITHEYIFNVTSCEPNPCGALAECWGYDDGSVSCECGNGQKVEYLEMCPLDSVICLQNKVFDVDKLECLCPKDKQETDADDFCFAAGSPCLDGPCTGVGSVCVDDGSGGYTCSCPDDSVVGATVNCDFATITTCDPPNPCGKEAYCAEIFDEEGAMTAGCQCNDDDREVEFGESCIVV